MHFIYNKILLKGKNNSENVLQEFRLVEKYDVLNTLGQLEQGTLENENEEVKKLEAIGLKYLNQFSIHNSNLLSDDDY